jgi:hypothetical protein
LELGHLLLNFLSDVIIWDREDERDRLGSGVGAPDEPLFVLPAFQYGR